MTSIDMIDIISWAIIGLICIFWTVDRYILIKRERELLDRIMARSFPEYMAGVQTYKQFEKREKQVKENKDVIPVT